MRILIWGICSEIAILGICTVCVALPDEKPKLRWNRDVTVPITPQQGSSSNPLPPWKVKQMVWPSDDEIQKYSVAVDAEIRESCMQWLIKFLHKDWIPSDIQGHLVAMKGWGLIREQSKQKRPCDVFIVRFKKTPYVYHIQESPYNVVITVCNEENEREDYETLIVETARFILHERLIPDENSDFHVFKQKDSELSRAVWLTKGVFATDINGKKGANLTNAAKNGAVSVKAETDGRLVRFDIVKTVDGPRSELDPYVERFQDTKK